MSSAQRNRPSRRRGAPLVRAGVVLGVLAGAAPAGAQGVAIEHDELGCLVAEKHPRVVACFAPRSRLARARVFFRAGGTEPWYFVEMKSDAPCFSGILPKPKRAIQSVDYYVAATDREFAESRTREFAPEVVPDEGSCRKGLLAPFLDKASVVVGSAAGAAIPAGFLGAGVSTGLVVGVVGAGAAVVGGVAAGGGGESTSPPSTTVSAPPTAVAPTSTTVGVPTTSTTTTSPTTTTTTTTTTTLPPTTTTMPPTTTLPPTTTMTGCTDTTPPRVTLTFPDHNGTLPAPPILLQATASDGGSGVARVEFYWQRGSAPQLIGTDDSGPAYTLAWSYCGQVPNGSFDVFARAVDGCGNEATSNSRNVTQGSDCLPAAASAAPAVAWRSELAVPGGRGQMILNGSEVFFAVEAGARHRAAQPRRRQNRIEAVLVEGGGRPGTWRFDLSASGIAPGSVRVIAGDAAAVSGDVVVFRLAGRAGERVVFEFAASSP